MPELHRSAASLRIMGDDLDPDCVSAILLCAPTRAHRKCDARILPDGGTLVGASGLWALADDTDRPLEAKVLALLGRVSPNIGVWVHLASRYRIDLFCGLFLADANEGLMLSPGTLRTLGERGIALSLDLYAP